MNEFEDLLNRLTSKPTYDDIRSPQGRADLEELLSSIITKKTPQESPKAPQEDFKKGLLATLGNVKTNNKAVPYEQVNKHALHGDKAIEAVEALEGPLTPAQKRVVSLEGFVPVLYKDSKGVDTFGVGQTGKYIDKGFKQSFEDHVKRVRKRVPKFDSLPQDVQAELIQGEYRGDLGESPAALKLFNKGKYKEAAKEFLNNAEYKNYVKTGSGGNIRDRMEAISRAMSSLYRG